MIIKQVKHGTISFTDVPVASAFRCGGKVCMRTTLFQASGETINAVDLATGALLCFEKIDQVQLIPDAHVVAP